MSVETNTPEPHRISRRTLAAGAAWAAPAVAVAAAAPTYAKSGITTTTTTLPPCIAALGTTGGTYPVSVSLSNCSTASSHWDFIFSITAATSSSTCLCNGVQPTHLRITLFDNPKRTRLWISNTNTIGNPTTNTNNSPRLYVQKVLAVGATAPFPAQGDAVRRVGGPSPYGGFVTDSGTIFVGNITAPGTADDSLHTLILPDGSVPCDAPGPMAYVQVECGQSSNGPWTLLGGRVEINPCVPMIQATACVYDSAGNDRFRLGISVLNGCGIPSTKFKVTNIQRNSDTNFPNNGTSVWSGSQALGPGTTNIETTTQGAGNQLWISFTTDDVNTSRIRIPVTTTICPPGLSSDKQSVEEKVVEQTSTTTTSTTSTSTTTISTSTTTTAPPSVQTFTTTEIG